MGVCIVQLQGKNTKKVNFIKVGVKNRNKRNGIGEALTMFVMRSW